MSQSAMSTREAKKADTLHRIEAHAVRLTTERGFDGWTMDDLADAAQVSRRTLFNYVPSKVEATLGSPSFDLEAIATFAEGGPSGDLVADLGFLGSVMLTESDFDLELAQQRRALVLGSSKLIHAAHQHFEELVGQFVELVITREGPTYDLDRARLLVRVMVVVFESAMDRLSTEPGSPSLAALFEDSLATARELLA